jgi:hypothetical protein
MTTAKSWPDASASHVVAYIIQKITGHQIRRNPKTRPLQLRKISDTKLDIGDANRLNRRLSAFRILGSGQTANTRNGGREIDNVDAKDIKTIYFVF